VLQHLICRCFSLFRLFWEVQVSWARLTFTERAEIARLHDGGAGIRAIARALERAPSTILRELKRNLSPSPRRYRAFQAHIMARERGRRPRPGKLAAGTPVRAAVVTMLRADYSPWEVEGRLRLEHPGDRGMQVSHETIYQALFVQGKGSLRAEVDQALRCGRRRRRPRGGGQARPGPIVGAVPVSARPAEADDRAVPGHWEGDLIIGKNSQSAVVTLAERASRFCLIIALPGGRTADKVADALADRILTLPAALRRTLTWDRGTEMAAHADFTIATKVKVFFADPHSPWQRGTNENTNGLIRYYLPKGTDLSVHTQADLDAIADKLNTRPRRTLGYRTPAEALDKLLAA
jgi:IS30 family transposase